MSNNVTNWMSWREGVDFMGGFADGEGSMVLVHVAGEVQTPVGTAPSGMVLIQEAGADAPSLIGFISTDQKVADYFGSNIFAGTPFENAPGLVAEIDVQTSSTEASANVKVAGTEISLVLSNLAGATRSNRDANSENPFYQQVLESAAGEVSLTINGEKRAVVAAPSQGGAHAAVLSHAGMYSR